MSSSDAIDFHKILAAKPLDNVPISALDRIKAIKKNSAFFNSDFSPGAIALAGGAGIQSIGQVTGGIVYLRNPYQSSFGLTGEVHFLSDSRRAAILTALIRLKEQARFLGAHAVFGVQITEEDIKEEFEPQAIRVNGMAARFNIAPTGDTPKLFRCSVEEYVALNNASYRAVGFVYGMSIFYRVSAVNSAINVNGKNVKFGSPNSFEAKDYTSAVYSARTMAMAQMDAQATELGAQGIVEVEDEVSIESVGGSGTIHPNLLIKLSLYGTAITKSWGSSGNIGMNVSLADPQH